MKISMKLAFQYMAIFFNFYTTSNNLHPLQVENCDSNSRLVVDEDDNGKLRLESVKWKGFLNELWSYGAFAENPLHAEFDYLPYVVL